MKKKVMIIVIMLMLLFTGLIGCTSNYSSNRDYDYDNPGEVRVTITEGLTDTTDKFYTNGDFKEADYGKMFFIVFLRVYIIGEPYKFILILIMLQFLTVSGKPMGIVQKHIHIGIILML